MISIDKCRGSYHAPNDLSTKKHLSRKTKDTNVNIPNVKRRIYEAKALVKYILGNYKCKFNSATCNSN